MIRRLFCLSVVLWLSVSAAASSTRYRVALTLYPGDDAAAIARQVASTYGGRLEEESEGGRSVTSELSEATARLASRDPRVESLQPVSNADPTWTRGTYRYDGSGNISQIGEEDYRYDKNGRLVHGDAGPDAHQSYTYDAFGNILTINTVEPGVSPTASRLAVDPATNQIDKPDGVANVVGTYDPSGNLTSYNGTTVLKYDALNVVTEATIPDVTPRRVFLYTASDERVAAISLLNNTVSETEWTLRDAGGKVLRRVSKTPGGTWQWKQDYIYRGTQLLAAEVADNRKTLRFHLDHLGTPRLITANGGVEVARPRYFAFGQEVRVTADAEPMKFTGHERDGRSLDYMHARYYDPLMGRFVSVDPVIDKKAAAGAPQLWNRYSYVRNNPAGAVDPNGMREALLYGARHDVERGDVVILVGRDGKARHTAIVAGFVKGKNGLEALVVENGPVNSKGQLVDDKPHQPTPVNSNSPAAGSGIWNAASYQIGGIARNAAPAFGVFRHILYKQFTQRDMDRAIARVGQVRYDNLAWGGMGLTCDCAGYVNQLVEALGGRLSPRQGFFGPGKTKDDWLNEAKQQDQ